MKRQAYWNKIWRTEKKCVTNEKWNDMKTGLFSISTTDKTTKEWYISNIHSTTQIHSRPNQNQFTLIHFDWWDQMNEQWTKKRSINKADNFLTLYQSSKFRSRRKEKQNKRSKYWTLHISENDENEIHCLKIAFYFRLWWDESGGFLSQTKKLFKEADWELYRRF